MASNWLSINMGRNQITLLVLSPSVDKLPYANYNVAPHDGSSTLECYCKETKKKGRCIISSQTHITDFKHTNGLL